MTETPDEQQPKSDWPFWQALLKEGRKLGSQEWRRGGMPQSKEGSFKRTHRIRLWNGYVGWRLRSTNADGKSFDFSRFVLSDTEKERIAKLEEEYKPRPVSQSMVLTGWAFSSDPYIDFSDLVFLNASFSGATFSGTADFRGATFSGTADFSDVRFSGTADFYHATFSGPADFYHATFSKWVGFHKAKFFDMANFNNVQFKASSNFNKAEFLKEPPTFFEARLHEDTSFLDAKFPPPPKDRKLEDRKPEDRKLKDRKEADRHVRAWQRLARIMNEQERPAERHRFYRLEMQAQRVVDGKKSWAYWSNRLYEMICDFGYGIGRAFAWWVGHMLFFAVSMLALLTDNIACLSSKTFWSALAVSTSNAHPFFGLQKTWNGNAYADIITMAELQGVLPKLQIIGNAQVFFGPIFLFLLLLTFRNRFRIG